MKRGDNSNILVMKHGNNNILIMQGFGTHVQLSFN